MFVGDEREREIMFSCSNKERTKRGMRGSRDGEFRDFFKFFFWVNNRRERVSLFYFILFFLMLLFLKTIKQRIQEKETKSGF